MSGNGHLRHTRRWCSARAVTGVLQELSLEFCKNCRWSSIRETPGPQKPGIAFLRTPIPILTGIMQFRLIALLTLAIASVNGAAHHKRSRTCTCASQSYTASATQDAITKAGSGPFAGFPHQFKNHEGFTFSCSGTAFAEFPILASGALFNGSTSPGPDRVVWDNSGDFCGCITHTGASGGKFLQCTS
ncbi:Ribonuclease/ribotoxin [Thelephora terrestris]|uniref:Ribonuclease/ribotoxin n=1 Tax=Thelephora terrestris TaxID=56493 RepID=A0A9P6HQB1_9AGAM|nr:Ribonuclease/ribotoxin [Thelephora terrestris]